MKKNASQMLDSSLNMQEDLEQDNGLFSFLVQRESGVLWDRMADVDIRRKRTSNLPCHESIVQGSAQKQRQWEIVDTLLCRFGND